jgi:hypothetical protein
MAGFKPAKAIAGIPGIERPGKSPYYGDSGQSNWIFQ